MVIDPDPLAEWLKRAEQPKDSPASADEILATGTPATAQIVALQLTGRTAAPRGGIAHHPERANSPMVILGLMVQPPASAGFEFKTAVRRTASPG